MVQTVRLDDVLRKVSPTMIKMDIEGAELDALAGAERIIQEHQPDLAICAYHKLSHLWEIPLLIHAMVPQYRLYMRGHYQMGQETVLYATVEEHP
jgi:hypothetical protein